VGEESGSREPGSWVAAVRPPQSLRSANVDITVIRHEVAESDGPGE